MEENEEVKYERLHQRALERLQKAKEEKQKKLKEKEDTNGKKQFDANKSLTCKLTFLTNYFSKANLKLEIMLMHRTQKLKDNQGQIIYSSQFLSPNTQFKAFEINYTLDQKVNVDRLQDEYGETEKMNIFFVFSFLTLKDDVEEPFGWFALPLFMKKEH
jgi:hypothetical protein